MLSKSIEQLRQPNVHLQESEEEEGEEFHDHPMQEDSSPSGGVIRRHSPDSNRSSGSPIEPLDTHPGVIRVKEEPDASDDETMATQSLADRQSSYIHQVNGRMVIQAMIWNDRYIFTLAHEGTGWHTRDMLTRHRAIALGASEPVSFVNLWSDLCIVRCMFCI